MKENNIWNNINFDKEGANILWELKRQAELLSEKTDGILYAEVNPIDAYDEKSAELAIIYNFHVCAPFLGNLRTLFFTVAELKDSIKLIDRIGTNGILEVKTMLELISGIEKLISSDETKRQLSNLFSSSIEIKTINQKKKRPGEEWAKIIEKDFFVTHSPYSTSVKLKGGKTYEGYFQTFDDWILLKEKLKFRFIEFNKAVDFMKAHADNKSDSKSYSIIIDCAEVEDIKLTKRPESSE